MLANDVSEVIKSAAMVIGSLGALAFAVGIMSALLHQRKLTARIDSKLGHIDLAVNGVAHTDDDPPLVEKVRRIERTLARICAHLDIPHHTTESD